MKRLFATLFNLVVIVAVAIAADQYDVTFSTYFDSSGFAQVRDIVSDAQGNIYVTGGTDSVDYPRTIGPAHQGSFDVFVTKFDRSGRLVWSRLLGGPEYDRAYGIEIDASGYVCLTGRSGHGFPVTAGAQQTTFQGYYAGDLYGWQDAFAAKLSPDGSTVIWATYFGTAEMCRDFDLDPSGNFILSTLYDPTVGQAPMPSAWFANGYQKAPKGQSDNVIAQLSADGRSIMWATYLCGSGIDSGKSSIRRAPDGSIYSFTDTTSTDLPTPNGYQKTNRGLRDFYLAKLTSNGSGLLWATYFGGNGYEWCETHHLAVDANGNAYINGTTESTDVTTTAGAFQRAFAGVNGVTEFHAIGDALVAKFSTNGVLLASTYVGGRYGDNSQGLAVDAAKNVYFTGGTVSNNFPLAGNSYQPNQRGAEDFIICKLSADFSQLLYSTYVGTSGSDEGRTLWCDGDGTIYVAGQAVGSDWPVRNAAQPNYGGGLGDNIIMKFSPSAVSPNQLPVARLSAAPSSGSAPLTVSFDGTASTDPDGSIVAYAWNFGDGSSGSGSTTSHTYAVGSYAATLTVTDNAGMTATSNTMTVTVNAPANMPPSVSLSTNGTTFTSPASITLSANAADSDGSVSKVDFYQGATLIGTDTNSPYSIAWNSVAAGTYSLTARATDNAGAATSSASTSITVNPPNVPPTGMQTSYSGSPMSIPGTITTAQYDNGGEGVAYHDIDASNNSSSTYRLGLGVDSNGSGVGWVFAGEWIEYTLTVGTAGTYAVSIPMSNPGTGGTFHLSFDGVNKTGTLNVPATSNWETKQTVIASITLSAGTQVMQIAFDSNGSTGSVCGLGDIVITSSSGGSIVGTGTGLTGQYFDNADFTGANFTRTDATINFDWGMGAPANSMGIDYFSIRWTGQVQAQYTQTYTFYVTGDDGVRLWVNGNLLIDKWLVQAPTEYAATMALTAGTKYDIKLEYYENYGGTAAQLRWSSAGSAKQVIPSSQLYPSGMSTGGQNPYSGTPMAIPGTISVPRYDMGGEGVAYHDMEASNLMSGTWRLGEAVDTDNNRGIGWIQAGEWVEYTVNVSTAGTYTLSLPVCHPGPGGTFHINFNGVNMTGPMTVPNTGSWEINQAISTAVNLNVGIQIMQVVFDTNGSTGYVCGIGDMTCTSLPTSNG